LIKALSEIEITARSVIAYRHGHRYGALGYLEAGNFNEKHDHEKFIRQFEVSIQNNRNSLFVKHHMEVYESHFPIWVATELFTMGMVSLFFADLLSDDKKAIAKEYNTDYVHLESWLHSSSVLRNICAHYGRFYNIRFHQSPRLPRKQAKRVNRNESSLFNQVYMLKFLYKNYRDEWNNAILSLLSALIEKHDKFLDLKTMGFPPNWEETLSW
jgi:abortive infection bacteriophage resistance protein